MGTETKMFFVTVLIIYTTFVKLNNPLMGTETLAKRNALLSSNCLVKLNNPLMGTETRNSMPPHSPRIITQLN